MDDIYAIAEEIGRNFQDESGQSLREILESKTRELQDEFEKLYGRSGSEMWQKLLSRNT